MERLTDCYHVAVRSLKLVAESDGPPRKFDDPRPNDQLIFVTSRCHVAAVGLGHGQKQLRLFFHIAIREPAIVAKLAAAYLEPHQVICIISHAHLVGFGITNPDARFRNSIGDGRFVLCGFVHPFEKRLSQFRKTSQAGDCNRHARNTQAGGIASDLVYVFALRSVVSVVNWLMIERAPALATDLYELTMAAAYFDNRIDDRAIFELLARRLPANRTYLIAAGLEQAIDYLASLKFTGEQIAYLREHPGFKHVSKEFFDYLAQFKFTGDLWAVPEGTAVFAMEPLVRVEAPIIEAQVIETFLLSTINFQTMIASKAARVVTAARGRNVIEFGTRRAHGTEAGLFAARAAYIAGCDGTSNVEAGYLFGIPTLGTLAHSFVMVFDKEDEAFRAFLKVFPDTATILVDTYDTVAAVERLTRDFKEAVSAIRLDSGDLCELSIRAREILDRGGMIKTKILASSDLNEYRINDLLLRGARIDAFGVGTELATSADAPALAGVYKLVGMIRDGHIDMKIKLSADKSTYPGPKQIWRMTDETGKYNRDMITLADSDHPFETKETGALWHPLLEQVMKAGQRVEAQLPRANSEGDEPQRVRQARLLRLNRAQARAADELKRLPEDLLALDSEARYPVRHSERLEKERERLKAEITDARRSRA